MLVHVDAQAPDLTAWYETSMRKRCVGNIGARTCKKAHTLSTCLHDEW